MLQVLGLVNRIQPHLNGWFTVLQLFILLENFQLSGKPQPEPSNGTCPDSSRFFVCNLALSCQFRLRKSLWRSAACHHRVFPNDSIIIRLPIGIWNESASKYTATSKLRELFPEFEGRQLNVSYHKGWNSICTYLLKEDKSPVVWGEESLELVRERAVAAASKRRGPDLVKLLRGKSSWKEVILDDNLAKKCLSSYSSVLNTFIDMQAAKKSTHVFERLASYVKEKGGLVYTRDELKERFPLLIWLVFSICRDRHLRQRQMIVLGDPGTHKTDMVQSLSQIFNVYFVPRRARDFTGADKDFDLWVIDELSGYDTDVDTLNMLLDGQKVSLDCKYGRVFEKTKNVPIILISNKLPYNYDVESFRTRVHEMHFFSDCAPIDPGRLASTLFVLCIRYYVITSPEGDGINNHLGKELVSDAEKAMLEVRTGDAFMFRPLRDMNRLRQDKGLVALLRRSYEVFSLPVSIEFPKTLHQWEKNSNYWDAAYQSLSPAVAPVSTSTSSKRNSSSVPVAPSTTSNTSTRQCKEVARDEDFFPSCADHPDTDKGAKAKNCVAEKEAVEHVVPVTPAVTSSNAKPMNPDDAYEPFF